MSCPSHKFYAGLDFCLYAVDMTARSDMIQGPLLAGLRLLPAWGCSLAIW